MCLIIFQEQDSKKIDADLLKDEWDFNPHGAGIATIEDGSVKVQRFTKFRRFIKAYEKTSDASMRMIHFRFNTRGSNGIGNVHPFLVSRGKIAMAHNGTFSDVPQHRRMSDSSMIAESLHRVSASVLMSGEFDAILNQMCGTTSKMVLMSGRGEIKIINEDIGEWYDEKTWMSVKGSLAPASMFSTLGYPEDIDYDDDYLKTILDDVADEFERYNENDFIVPRTKW